MSSAMSMASRAFPGFYVILVYTCIKQECSSFVFLFVCFIVLRAKSTAMAMAGRSVQLNTQLEK